MFIAVISLRSDKNIAVNNYFKYKNVHTVNAGNVYN